MKGFLLRFFKSVKVAGETIKRMLKSGGKERVKERKSNEKHVRNFAPTHYSWRKSLGKDKKKKSKKWKNKKFSKKTNNSKG